jgi:hypothetical protein
MSLSRISLAFAAATLALSGVAVAQPSVTVTADRFVHDGVAYEYTSEVVGSRTIYRGTARNGLVPFKLVVRGERVRGEVGDRQVAFRLKDRVRLPARERLAAR